MKRVVVTAAALAVLLASGVCQAVEPAYVGPLGNSEEPALRPYKWFGQGVASLFYHTGERFVHGNMKTPVIGSVEGLRGVRRGTLKMAHSTWKGMLGAPLPRRGSQDYKQLGPINVRLEAEPVRSNAGDFVFSWWYYPVLKTVDLCPMETEEQVAVRKENARAIREARKTGEEPQLIPVPKACPFVSKLCCESGCCQAKQAPCAACKEAGATTACTACATASGEKEACCEGGACQAKAE